MITTAGEDEASETDRPPVGPPAETLEELEQARELVRQAREALQNGDFSTFGDRFNRLEQLLERSPAPADTVQAMLRDMTAPLEQTSSPPPPYRGAATGR